MKYIDADQIYKELDRLEELIPVSDGNVGYNFIHIYIFLFNPPQ